MAKTKENVIETMEKWAKVAKIGNWAFIIGVLLAIIAAFVTIPYGAGILIILGLIVGLLNIVTKEIVPFLLATIALTTVGAAGLAAIPTAGTYIAGMLQNIFAFVAPAALVVALKAVYSLAKK